MSYINNNYTYFTTHCEKLFLTKLFCFFTLHNNTDSFYFTYSANSIISFFFSFGFMRLPTILVVSINFLFCKSLTSEKESWQLFGLVSTGKTIQVVAITIWVKKKRQTDQKFIISLLFVTGLTFQCFDK